MKATVSRNELLAALLFASTEESRFVLNGVLIETKPLSKPTLIASDGRRLVVIESIAEQSEETGVNESLLLRAAFVEPLCKLSKALGGKLYPWIEFEHKPGSKRVFVKFVGAECFLESERDALIDGEFPDWRKCLPPKGKTKREPISDVAFNSALMADFAKAAKLMEAQAPIMQMSLVGKEQQIEVKIPSLENFYGLIMQCKIEESVEYQPEFLHIVKDLPKPEVRDSQDEDTE